MGIMVPSSLWIMQGLFHQLYFFPKQVQNPKPSIPSFAGMLQALSRSDPMKSLKDGLVAREMLGVQSFRMV